MTDLKTIQIGKYEIGGPLGSRTGLAVGSIFYDKHSIVSDAFAGEFDPDRAGKLIERVNGLAETYGIQMAFDVIAASPEAMECFIEFIVPRTDLPFMINASEADVHIAGLEIADRLGVLDRVIFASLNEDTEDEIIEALGKHRPACVMVLANDVGDPTPEGSVAMVENMFHPMMREIGIDRVLVDLGAMDPPSVGISMRGITAIRDAYGYPAGCAFSNCFPQWTGLRELGKDFVNLSLASAMVSCRAAGGDFLHYGIIEKARVAAHTLGSAEVFFGFAAQELDGNRLPEGHALLKMFKLAASQS